MKRVKYPCAICKNTFKKDEIRRDHIDPVVNPATGFPLTPTGEDDWNVYIKRLLGKGDNIQMICKGCHDLKSNKEKELRKQAKKNLTIKKKKGKI